MRTKIILLSLLMVLSSCREGRMRYYHFPDVIMSLEGGTCTIDTGKTGETGNIRIEHMIDNNTGLKYYPTNGKNEISAPGIKLKVVKVKEDLQLEINVEASSMPQNWTVNIWILACDIYTLNIIQK